MTSPGSVLAAVANAVLLFGIALYVILEAVKRLQDPPEVLAGPMLIVAVFGLFVNITGWRLLRSGAEESLDVKGAYYEVVADLVGSVAVIVAALILIVTGWPYADALFADSSASSSCQEHGDSGTRPSVSSSKQPRSTSTSTASTAT